MVYYYSKYDSKSSDWCLLGCEAEGTSSEMLVTTIRLHGVSNKKTSIWTKYTIRNNYTVLYNLNIQNYKMKLSK